MLKYIELYITHLSRYAVPVFLVIYMIESFLVFRYDNEESRKGLYNRQIVFMFHGYLFQDR